MGSVTCITPCPCLLCGVWLCWPSWVCKGAHARQTVELCWPDAAGVFKEVFAQGLQCLSISNTPEIPADSPRHPPSHRYRHPPTTHHPPAATTPHHTYAAQTHEILLRSHNNAKEMEKGSASNDVHGGEVYRCFQPEFWKDFKPACITLDGAT